MWTYTTVTESTRADGTLQMGPGWAEQMDGEIVYDE
jgi:hypothetical protein